METRQEQADNPLFTGAKVLDTVTGYYDDNGYLYTESSNRGTERYVYNAHGDVIALIDNYGRIRNEYAYDDWGVPETKQQRVENPILYAGEYYDGETGQIYLRARYYQPGLRRFVNMDTYWNLNNFESDNVSKAVEGSNRAFANSKKEDLDKENFYLKFRTQDDVTKVQSYNMYVYCMNNPVKYADPSGRFLVIAGVIISGAELALLGTGIVILGYLASKAFIKAFTTAYNNGKTIRDSILYAKGKAKDPEPPSKLKDGDKVKTPDSHPEEWQKNKDGSYTHKKTGWKAEPAKPWEQHGGPHWDMSPERGKGHINVGPDGNVF